MKRLLGNIYYSFPAQLFFLHFKVNQLLLIPWLLLIGFMSGTLLSKFGVPTMFLMPEYLGHIGFVSGAIMGVAFGVFTMSWNITTFILHHRHFNFLVATRHPFLKYCINNFVFPVFYILLFMVLSFNYNMYHQYSSFLHSLLIILGFVAGLALQVYISFVYFFRIGKTSRFQAMSNEKRPHENLSNPLFQSRLMKVKNYLSTPFKIRTPRDVSHYEKSFVNRVLGRHNFMAVIAMVIAFGFLISIGMLLDIPFFELPAGAAMIIFLSFLIAMSGVFSFLLKNWSIVGFVVLIFTISYFNDTQLIQTGTSVFGLDYSNKIPKEKYDEDAILALLNKDSVASDKKNMELLLDAWKLHQQEEKPLMYILCMSGGGNRSATFTMNVLQQLDSLSNGLLMKKTALLSGISGGMIGGMYFRALYQKRSNGDSINIRNHAYTENVSKDLLNPIFSSLVARDLIAPSLYFNSGNYRYKKDRAYAFEKRLNENLGGLFCGNLGDYAEAEKTAAIPMAIFAPVITRDGRKMLIGTQPMRFMMRAENSEYGNRAPAPDAVDYLSFFTKRNPLQTRFISAIRMNATFPLVLPNAVLPTEPQTDMIDAGLKDNYGQDVAIRFIGNMSDWIGRNTSGVVLIEITDRRTGAWENPYEGSNFISTFTKPVLMVQHNWQKLQEYNQNQSLALLAKDPNIRLKKITFEYIPTMKNFDAGLNFHLTKREEQDIHNSLQEEANQRSFKAASTLFSRYKP